MSVWEGQTKWWFLVIFIVLLPFWLTPALTWLLVPQALGDSFLFGAFASIVVMMVFRVGRMVKTMGLRFTIVIMAATAAIGVLLAVISKLL